MDRWPVAAILGMLLGSGTTMLYTFDPSVVRVQVGDDTKTARKIGIVNDRTLSEKMRDAGDQHSRSMAKAFYDICQNNNGIILKEYDCHRILDKAPSIFQKTTAPPSAPWPGI